VTDREVPRELSVGDPDHVSAALAGHPFTDGMDLASTRVLAEGAAIIEVEPRRFLFRQGGSADAMYLLLDGDVDLEVAAGGSPPLVLESLHAGDAVGWSWLFPPHSWLFDAHARSFTRAIAVDAARMRAAIAEDPVFGRDLTSRVAELVIDRLRHARLQLVDSWSHDHRA
jgi:CRP/FNR family transcriptional regulator, cyclic AMP receptor protein